MTCLENMIAFYNKTPEDNLLRSVVGNLLTHLEQVEDATIYTLSDICYTSPATISRLVKKLGYKNYTYFKKDLSDCVNRYEHLNRYVSVDEIEDPNDINNMFLNTLETLLSGFRNRVSKEQLKSLAELLHSKKSVSIYTYGTSFSEFYLQSDLFMTGISCDIFNEYSSQLKSAQSLNRDSLAIFVMPKCIESADAERIISIAKERGAVVCVITDTRFSSLTKRADYSFAFEGKLYLIDMYILQIFISLLSIEYRRLYLDS